MMLQTMIEKGVTPDNVAALEGLMKLHERMQDKQAERDYAASFAALQCEMPKVEATRAVPNNDGSTRYKFAPYEEIMRQVQPSLAKHGFAVTFDNSVAEGRVTAVCTLMHVSGHARSNSFAVRIGKGPPGSSESQQDGSASTYAKRFALCNALNIVIEHETMEDDARIMGANVTPEVAEELKRRVHAAKVDEKAFLTYAGAAHYEAITEERYPDLDKHLVKAEKKAGVRNPDGTFAF